MVFSPIDPRKEEEMRSEREMIRLLLEFANRDENIRVVLMNGSRVNPNAQKDPFQDFDIVYLVKEVAPYVRNQEIPCFFGDILIMQLPEDMSDPPPEGDGHYTYLMQFMDGNRIDLSFYSLDRLEDMLKDSLTVVLLDKDGLARNVPPPSDKGYRPKAPTEKSFQDCCNEFWWLNPYVAKGLWRGELIYAKYILDKWMRDELLHMLDWYFGIKTGFTKSAGKLGKYLQSELQPELWTQLEQTYSDSDFNHIWESLFVMGRLFRKLARQVASYYEFTYPEQDDRNVVQFIQRIRSLPLDAKEI